jgi:O-acetylhomoserine/O-acetylserine sulfhydrylase-like pyridoxal-dependent enzyme
MVMNLQNLKKLVDAKTKAIYIKHRNPKFNIPDFDAISQHIAQKNNIP